MSFEAAIHEVLVEDACRASGLDEATTGKVIQSYRFSPGFLRTVLEHGGDHATYVEAKLVILKALGYA